MLHLGVHATPTNDAVEAMARNPATPAVVLPSIELVSCQVVVRQEKLGGYVRIHLRVVTLTVCIVVVGVTVLYQVANCAN